MAAGLVSVGLWALPEIVRRVAVAKIPQLTGRAASIEDVDLNLFTGRFAVKNLRIARRPGHGPEAFVEFDRLDGHVGLLAMLRSEVRVIELKLSHPTVRVTRTGPIDFDVSDLLQLFAKPAGKEAPSSWVFSLGRLEIAGGAVVMDDAFLAPQEQWRVEGFGLQASDLTTRPDQPSGRLRLDARVGDARLQAISSSVNLAPLKASLDVSLTGFDLARVRRYLPPDLPAVPETGRVGFALRLEQVRTGEALGESSLSGEIRVEALSLVQRDRTAPFLKLDRLTVAIKQMDFLVREVTLAGIDVEGFDLKAARDKSGEIDLLAALSASQRAETVPAGAGTAPATGPPPVKAADSPSGVKPGKLTLERLTLRSGTLTVTDEAVSPGREWRIDGVTVDGAGLSTSAQDTPGTLRVRAKMTARPGSTKPASLVLDADAITLVPFAASARVSLDGFALAAIEPYWPPSLPAVAPEGLVGFTVKFGVEQGDAGLTRAVASGGARIDGLSVVQRGHPMPFLKIPKVTVGLKQVDAVARTLALGEVEIEGSDLRVVRDPQGRIDLLTLAPAAPPAPETAKPGTGAALAQTPSTKPPAAAPAAKEWRVTLDRFTLGKGRAAFEDHKISPPPTLALTDLTMGAQRIAWPFTSHATFSLSLTMPGGGRTDAKGKARLEPLDVQISASTRETPIAPYRAYFPFAARLDGFFSGDSLSEVQRGPTGELILASRGTAWARDIEVRAPGAAEPVARLDSLEIRGIDFSWPNYALVERVFLGHPQVRLERDAQGNINLRTLFSARQDEAPARGAEPVARAPEPARAGGDGKPDTPADGEGGLLQSIVLDFTEIDVRNGFGRFVDRTTTPPFSEDISRLSVQIRDLSNVLGRPKRTTMMAQGLIGVDGALDVRGEVSGIGEALRADLVAELRDFSLASANPYADGLIAWTVQSGRLQAKIHYEVEGDRITATHALELKGLRVEKSRESEDAKRRIGVPLGLAVALLKDSDGNIDFTFPLTGKLGDRSFDYGEAIWAGVKQVITKILLAPFRAVGRLFKGGDDAVDKLEIDPVTFAPGSAVIAPSTEAQITKLAEFLRRSPQIKLALAPVVTSADVDNLKVREVRARLEAFRRDQQLPDLASALRVYYQQQLPAVAAPKTVEEQIALLAEREPVPTARVAEIARWRVENARDALVTARGIPAERVLMPASPPAEGPAPGGTGDGRVEFTIVAADG